MKKPKIDKTPTLAEVVRTLIDAQMVEVHTSLPGKIVTYDPLTQRANVQISLLRKFEDGPPMPIPILPNVPVVHARTKTARIHLPVSPGDDVVVVFSERSLDRWKVSGSLVDPGDRRRHSLSDGVAFLGGSGLPTSFQVTDPLAIEIVNAAGALFILPTGILKLGGVAATLSAAIAEKVEARLDAIEDKLNDLIGKYSGHAHPVTSAPGTTGPPTSPETPLIPVPDPIGSATVKVGI